MTGVVEKHTPQSSTYCGKVVYKWDIEVGYNKLNNNIMPKAEEIILPTKGEKGKKSNEHCFSSLTGKTQ